MSWPKRWYQSWPTFKRWLAIGCQIKKILPKFEFSVSEKQCKQAPGQSKWQEGDEGNGDVQVQCSPKYKRRIFAKDTFLLGSIVLLRSVDLVHQFINLGLESGNGLGGDKQMSGVQILLNELFSQLICFVQIQEELFHLWVTFDQNAFDHIDHVGWKVRLRRWIVSPTFKAVRIKMCPSHTQVCRIRKLWPDENGRIKRKSSQQIMTRFIHKEFALLVTHACSQNFWARRAFMKKSCSMLDTAHAWPIENKHLFNAESLNLKQFSFTRRFSLRPRLFRRASPFVQNPFWKIGGIPNVLSTIVAHYKWGATFHCTPL